MFMRVIYGLPKKQYLDKEMTRTNQSLWPPSNKNQTMYPKYNSLSLFSQEFVFSCRFLNRAEQICQPWRQAISNYPLTCVGYDSLSQGTCVYQHRLHCRKLLASTYQPHPPLWYSWAPKWVLPGVYSFPTASKTKPGLWAQQGVSHHKHCTAGQF